MSPSAWHVLDEYEEFTRTAPISVTDISNEFVGWMLSACPEEAHRFMQAKRDEWARLPR